VTPPEGRVVHWDDVDSRLNDRYGKRARWTDLGTAAGTRSVGVTRLQDRKSTRLNSSHSH